MSTTPEDFPDEKEQINLAKNPSLGILWDVLSGILIVGSLVVALLFIVIFLNPQSGVNPYPPTTLPPPIVTFTPSPTPKQVLPPTWTPGPSPTTAPTEPVPAATETQAPPTITQEVTGTISTNEDGEVSFVVEENFPSYTENTVPEEAGCDWLGVAGQVRDENGEPVDKILVEAGGFLGDEEISFLTLTGMEETYGEGGYEIKLSDQPVDSEGSVWIQLLNHTSKPFSEKIYFSTYNDCERNLILINFIQEPLQ